MIGNAKLSPRSRGISDLETRIARFARYEEWARCEPLRIEERVSPDLWARYYKLQDEILAQMREAQVLTLEIAKALETSETVPS
jgi:hypothetical protein